MASRKVSSLLTCGGMVRVVSPEICRKLRTMAEDGKIQWIKRGYIEGDLAEAFLVIAATNNREVQRLVIREAQERNILINIVDDPRSSTFHVPATVRRGEFLLAISTGGGSPAFSAQVRREIEGRYGSEYGEFVALLSIIRQRVISKGGSQRSHKKVFEKLLQSNILALVKEQDWSAVQDELTRVLPEGFNTEAILKEFDSAENR